MTSPIEVSDSEADIIKAGAIHVDPAGERTDKNDMELQLQGQIEAPCPEGQGPLQHPQGQHWGHLRR